MKRRTKIIIGLMTVCAASLTFAAACSSWETPYEKIDKNDYKASVRYDINGGQFASKDNVSIIDGFSLEDAQKGVKLAEPGSDARGEGKTTSTPSRSGYFLAGWYKVRELRVDKDGNPLDEDGNLCSVSNKPQGYIYSEKWNFEENVFKVSEAETSSKQSLTLYAGWIPNFKFNFTVQNGSTTEQFATYSIDPLIQEKTLELPYWEDSRTDDKENCSAEMQYGDFPKLEGKTFDAIFNENNEEVKETFIEHTGEINYENGTAINGNLTFNVEFRDGIWYHIHSAKQFKDNARVNGNYELYADITFDERNYWSESIAMDDFTGKIIGMDKQRTIYNAEVEQYTYSQRIGGLFGRIMKGAVIENVKFQNVTYYLNAATRLGGGEFGLFAGNIDAEAVIKNVEVNGTLKIGNVYSSSGDDPYGNYTVGLLCSNVNSLELADKLTYDIELKVEKVQSGLKVIYPHLATVENELVKLSVNPTPDVPPENAVKEPEQDN